MNDECRKELAEGCGCGIIIFSALAGFGVMIALSTLPQWIDKL